MARPWILACALVVCCVPATGAFAQSLEDENGCQGTTDDPCFRTGQCSVQGADWVQVVRIARSDLYDTMGWPGVCDQVHVALVQGSCSPGGAQLDVTVWLEADSVATVPEIVGPLSCGAEPPPGIPALERLASALLAGGLLVGGLLLVARRVAPRPAA